MKDAFAYLLLILGGMLVVVSAFGPTASAAFLTGSGLYLAIVSAVLLLAPDRHP